MKHPALARVFAVILAVVSLISVLGGVKGFSDNAKDNSEAVTYVDRLEKRRITYIETNELLASRTTYAAVNSALKENRGQHDSDAAEHRTDVATYSATKGGYTMGADALWAAKWEVEGAKAAFEEAKGKLLEAQAMKDSMNASIAECNNAAALCSNSAADVGRVMANYNTVLAQKPAAVDEPVEPTMPTPPAAPVEPVKPLLPDEITVREEPVAPTEPEAPEEEESEENTEEWEAYRAKRAQYDSDYSAWENDHAAWDAEAAYAEAYAGEYENAKAAYDAAMENYVAANAAYEEAQAQYEADMLSYEAKMVEYNKQQAAYAEYLAANEAWNTACVEALADADYGAWASSAAAGIAALSSAYNAMPEEMRSQFGGMDPDDFGNLPEFDPSSIEFSPELISQALGGAQYGLSQLAGILGQVSGGFSQAISAMDTELANSINTMAAGELTIPVGTDANTIIAVMDEMLQKGVSAVDGGLADIWYGLGELEKDKQELEEKKVKLDEEAAELDKQSAEADEIKTLEQKRNSSRITLTNVEEIKAAVDAGEALEVSAEKYINEYRTEMEKNFKLGKVMSALAIAAGVMGFIGIPAAYEKIKKRFWLVVPPILCLGCSAAAMVMSRGVSNPLFYASMAMVIFAAAHILVVWPKVKIPQ